MLLRGQPKEYFPVTGGLFSGIAKDNGLFQIRRPGEDQHYAGR